MILVCGGLLVGNITSAIEGDATPGADTALALFGAKILTYVLAPLGGAGLKILAGSVFGWKIAFFIIVAGDTVGSVANYFLGNRGIKLFQGANASPEPPRNWSLRSIWGLLAFRIVLSPAWDLISYGLGAKGIRFYKFLIASVIGGIPASALWAFLGAYLSKVVGQRQAILIAIVGVVLGVVVAVGYRAFVQTSRAKAKHRSDTETCASDEHRESA